MQAKHKAGRKRLCAAKSVGTDKLSEVTPAFPEKRLAAPAPFLGQKAATAGPRKINEPTTFKLKNQTTIWNFFCRHEISWALLLVPNPSKHTLLATLPQMLPNRSYPLKRFPKLFKLFYSSGNKDFKPSSKGPGGRGGGSPPGRSQKCVPMSCWWTVSRISLCHCAA